MKTEFEQSGRILDVDLLAALVALWRGGRSGSLRFSRGAISAGFDLLGGDVVGVSSSEPRFETSAILVRAGKLDATALDRLSVPPGGDAALAALQAGILTRREWKWGEKIRAIEILADLLGWSDGTYDFDAEARPAASDDFHLTVPRLVLELFLRSRDRNLVDHQLGATDVPLARSEDFDDLFPTFGLTADAESVVRLIDGRATASDIQKRAPADEFAVAKLIAALSTLGLVRPLAPSVAEAGPAEPVFPAPEPVREEEEEAPPPEVAPWPSTPVEIARPPTEPSPAEIPESGFGAPAPMAIEATPAEAPASEFGSPPLDVPLVAGEEPPETPESLISSWNEPSGRAPEIYSSEPAPGGSDGSPPPRRGPGLLLTGLIALLGAAVLAVILLRSRATAPPGTAVAAGPTAPPPATAAPVSVPTAAPAITIPPAETASAPASMRSRRAEATPRRPTAAPSPAPVRPTPAPERRPTAVASSPPSGGREEWVRMARRDQKRLAGERGTKYAVQLELACEVASLVDAWKHDKPAGSMWLLPVNHQGRECFRVLWGRYGSLEAARAGKARIPAFFTTASNHPAVVSVR